MEELYQEFIIELYKHPLNFGRIEKADYHAEIHNTTCGDLVEIFIRVDKKSGKITDAKFVGKGCAISQASASLFTNYLKGKTIDSLKKITKEDILSLLKVDLSKNPSRMKCALTPMDAMKKAISTSR